MYDYVIIGADGSQSIIRRNVLGDFKKINKYTSIQSVIKCREVKPCFEVFFDKSITDFYGWIIPKQKNNIIGIALKGKGSRGKYEVFLPKDSVSLSKVRKPWQKRSTAERMLKKNIINTVKRLNANYSLKN